MPLITIHARHDHHHAPSDDVVLILNNLRHDYDCLKRKVDYLMKNAEEFSAAIAAIDAETTRIADKLEELFDRITEGGMTAEEEDATYAELGGLLTRMRSIGHDPVNPVPAPE